MTDATVSDAHGPWVRGELHARLGRFTLDTGPFAWPLQGVTAVFGRSGCGKSTLLRAIAGLLPGARGALEVGGVSWIDGRKQWPPQRRDVGYVFQKGALFPHLSVRGNLMFAARRAPGSHDGPGADAHALEQQAQTLGIAHLLDRGTGTLSGGELQRVALARALLGRPRLLLLDEPLAALDWRARDALLDVIDAVARDSQLPMIMVSHMPEEIERLADRVVHMDAGHVQHVESLQAALSRPDSQLFDRLGPIAVLTGALTAHDEGLAILRLGGEELIIPAPEPWCSSARVRVYARDVALACEVPVGISTLNQLQATVVALTPSRAGHVLVRLELADGQCLWSEVTQRARELLGLREHRRVLALVKTASVQR